MQTSVIARHVVILFLCFTTQSAHAAPWYRGFYGNISGFFPSAIGEGFTREEMDIWKSATAETLLREGRGTVDLKDLRYVRPSNSWCGAAGYRFLSGHAIEFVKINVSTRAKCSISESITRDTILSDWTRVQRLLDIDCGNLVEKERNTLLSGFMFMGKASSPVLRIAQTVQQPTLPLPSSLQTDKEIKRYVEQNSSFIFVHKFSFYAQAGIGYLAGNQLTVDTRPENSSTNAVIPTILVVALGAGAQYHFGPHVTLDGSWAYMMLPWPSNDTLGSFNLLKLGCNIYL